MSAVTRAIAKGIPPKVHEPGKTKKKSAPKPSTKPAPKHHKRNATESSNDKSEGISDIESKPKAKKKKRTKQRRTEESPQPDSEVEIVDGAAPEPLVEEVEEDDPKIYGDEVSSNPSLKWHALTQILGGWAR